MKIVETVKALYRKHKNVAQPNFLDQEFKGVEVNSHSVSGGGVYRDKILFTCYGNFTAQTWPRFSENKDQILLVAHLKNSRNFSNHQTLVPDQEPPSLGSILVTLGIEPTYYAQAAVGHVQFRDSKNFSASDLDPMIYNNPYYSFDPVNHNQPHVIRYIEYCDVVVLSNPLDVLLICTACEVNIVKQITVGAAVEHIKQTYPEAYEEFIKEIV